MSMIGTAVAVSAAATIAGSAISAGAANSASRARSNALASLRQLDIPELNRMARTADAERFQGSLDLQRRVDPQAAALRSEGLSGLLKAGESGDAADAQSTNILTGLVGEQEATREQETALRTKLLSDAQAALDAGATLPPEFQAELVRTGLEKSAGIAGFRPEDRAGAAGTTVRKMIGSAGIALAETRRKGALENVAAAGGMATTRTNILATLAGQFRSIAEGQLRRSATLADAGQSLMPSYGLSGSDVANLSVTDTANRNKVTMDLAAEAGQRSINNANMVNGIIGAGVGALGSGARLAGLSRGPGSSAGGVPTGTGGNISTVNINSGRLPSVGLPPAYRG